MKATTKFSVLSLMLVFAVITAFSSTTEKPKPPLPNSTIRHQVSVLMTSDIKICGSYVIELRNQYGALVAPSKLYNPETSLYFFYERGFDGEAVRTALLRPMTITDPAQCDIQLFAEPVTIKGIFETGKTYRYNLVPKAQGAKE